MIRHAIHNNIIRSYVTFSVDEDALNFTQVNRQLVERQSVLADLDFNVLDLSRGKFLIRMQ